MKNDKQFGPFGTVLKDNGKNLYMVQFDTKNGHPQDGLIEVGCFSRGSWGNDTRSFFDLKAANRSYGQMNRHWQ